MTEFNYALKREDYNWQNALLWGNFAGHCNQSCRGSLGNRIVHLIIAGLEFWPGFSQVASIFEMFIVTSCSDDNHRLDPFLRGDIIPPRHIHYHEPVPSLDEPLNEWSQSHILLFHDKIAKSPQKASPMLMWSRWSDKNICPSIEGLKKLGRLLTRKHHLQEDSLRVCDSLQAFQKELNEIQHQMETVPGDFRKAFIVPTHSSRWGQKEDKTYAKRSEEYPQHILAVAVERKGNQLNIVLLDPMVRHRNDIIKAECIGLGPQMEGIEFSEQELVLSHIVNTTLNPQTTTLYHSNVLREKSNGCWVFALKDAITFLKGPQFLNTIRTSTTRQIHQFKLTTIETLPVEFIKVAQFSPEEFDKHFRDHPEQDSPEIREKIRKHQVLDQNQRIGHATVKWLQALGFHA